MSINDTLMPGRKFYNTKALNPVDENGMDAYTRDLGRVGFRSLLNAVTGKNEAPISAPLPRSVKGVIGGGPQSMTPVAPQRVTSPAGDSLPRKLYAATVGSNSMEAARGLRDTFNNPGILNKIGTGLIAPLVMGGAAYDDMVGNKPGVQPATPAPADGTMHALSTMSPQEQGAYYDGVAGTNGPEALALRQRGLAQGRFMNDFANSGGVQNAAFNQRLLDKHGEVDTLNNVSPNITRVGFRDGHKLYTNVGTQGFSGGGTSDGWENTAEYKQGVARAAKDKREAALIDAATTGRDFFTGKPVIDQQKLGGLRAAMAVQDQLSADKRYGYDANLLAHAMSQQSQTAHRAATAERQAIQDAAAADKAKTEAWEKNLRESGFKGDDAIQFQDFVHSNFTLPSADGKGPGKKYQDMTSNEILAALPHMKQQFQIMRNVNKNLIEGRSSLAAFEPESRGDLTFDDVARIKWGDRDVFFSPWDQGDNPGIVNFALDKINPLTDTPKTLMSKDGRKVLESRYLEAAKEGPMYRGDLKNSLNGIPTHEEKRRTLAQGVK